MQPKDPQLLDVLNDVLSAELTAINQYFIHAKMCGNWGYARLHKHVRAESIDEMRHAEKITERILFLDGIPNYQRLYKVNVGETVEEQFKSDLALEYTAVERLNKGIQLAVAAGDGGTRALLEAILVSEEEHIDWLETQLETIRQISLPNYRAQQMRE
jgi:bacterioferritin